MPYGSLPQVEFDVVESETGQNKAVNVTGPGGQPLERVVPGSASHEDYV